MHVLFACLADHASVDSNGGKLNVMGVFDTIGAKAFPATHPKMVLAVRLLIEHEDNNTKGELVVALRDHEKEIFAAPRAEFRAGAVQPGAFATHNLIIELNGVVFAHPGRYHFAVRVGKGDEVRVPLAVVQA